MCAMKEGVRDSGLFHWVADEMGIDTPLHFALQIDSKQAHSFQRDTCPKSKIRGSFDMRGDWVQELRDLSVVETKLIDTSRNLADIFTKCLPRAKFEKKLIWSTSIMSELETVVLGQFKYCQVMWRPSGGLMSYYFTVRDSGEGIIYLLPKRFHLLL